MIPEREREALMRLTMCARKECAMCIYHGNGFPMECYEIQTNAMNTLADALRVADTPQPDTHDLHTETHECVSDTPQTDRAWK